MKMGIYKKRPLPQRAFQWDGSAEEARQIGAFLKDQVITSNRNVITIKTPSSITNATPGDWFIEEAPMMWIVVGKELFEATFYEVLNPSGKP